MRKALKAWSTNLYESLTPKLEGRKAHQVGSISTEQYSIFLQVVREWVELDLKHKEDYCIVDTIGSYQNKKFDEAFEWINEVEIFINETKPELDDKANMKNYFWCQKMLFTIRKIRAKRSSNLTFQRESDAVGSSSSPLSLREQLYCEITSLIHTYYAVRNVIHALHGHQLIGDTDRQQVNEVEQFLVKIKLQLQEKVPETNSDWYRNKIAEARTLIDKCEPEFSLQSHQDNVAPPVPLLLHEELRSEIRLLTNLQSVDMLVSKAMSKVQDPLLQDKYVKEAQELMNEMNKFTIETNLQLLEKVPGKSSDWYSNKIAESRTLTAKRYSTFPLRSQDVGYTNEQFQIFLSFRGEDTRYSFTRNLYDALRREGFKVFMDDEGLKTGDTISQVLMGAIENSKVSIIVFSENFADSSWCLDEVDKILDCKEKNDQLVWPIFYKVEPTDVRYQKKSYEKAMAKHEARFGKDSEKVKKWRSSLFQICNLKAFHYKENSGYEGTFIQDIIRGAKNVRDH